MGWTRPAFGFAEFAASREVSCQLAAEAAGVFLAEAAVVFDRARQILAAQEGKRVSVRLQPLHGFEHEPVEVLGQWPQRLYDLWFCSLNTENHVCSRSRADTDWIHCDVPTGLCDTTPNFYI